MKARAAGLARGATAEAFAPSWVRLRPRCAKGCDEPEVHQDKTTVADEDAVGASVQVGELLLVGEAQR
jgi:hypothetical protein